MNKMNDTEKLTKIIDKAVRNGYQNYWMEETGWKVIEDGNDFWITCGISTTLDIEKIIFDHSFAKAYFGEEDIDWAGSIMGISWHKQQSSWKHHLQQLVLADNRIEYLYMFI